jgi:hypothetical protein
MLQRMLKMLPSWPNSFRTTAEDVAYSALLGWKSASSVRQTVFSWQSDIPSHIFWRSSRVSRPENIADFKQMPCLAPPDRIFQYQSLCFYLTHYQSFPHFCRHQIISITADSWGKKARANSRLINTPSIWIWLFQSGDIQMHSYMFRRCAFANHIFLCNKRFLF